MKHGPICKLKTLKREMNSDWSATDTTQKSRTHCI